MDYIYFKLITGEELLGELETPIDQSDSHINVSNPVILTFFYDTDGASYTKCYDYLYYAETKLLTFRLRDIITYTSPNDTLLKTYQKYLGGYGKESSPTLLTETIH